jgi:large subunit ribosomal protein L17
MRHRNITKTFGRSQSARMAVLRDIVTSLVVYEKIKTTEAKGKSARRTAERLISRAKNNDLATRKYLLKYFSTEQPVNKLLNVLGPRYKDRNGGYTRIVKLGARQGDASPMIKIELV